MNETTTETNDSKNIEAEEVATLPDDATEDERAEHYVKLENLNKQLFARAKKAEGFEMKDGKWVKLPKPESKPNDQTVTPKDEKISSTDLYAIIKADVPEEDIDEVVEYATLKKISVSEALKSDIVKTILASKAEQRKVAEGTNTGTARRGSAKLSDEALISNAMSGKYPDSDEDMKRLAVLQRAKK